MPFIPIAELLQGKHDDESITIRGWVYRKREGKQMIFLVLRDASGTIQCTVKADSPAWSDAEKLTIESSLALEGLVKQDKRAPGGYEISAERISIIGLAEVFPISKDQSEEFLRDVRHLWLRSRKMNLVMKVRAEVLETAREFFAIQKFFEVSPPMFITSACEGGSTLFGLKYFDQNMYLTQSSQLYLEILIYSLEKVYCIAPSFRAEKSRTISHSTEKWHMEGEWPFADMTDLMRFEEGLLAHVCQRTVEKCSRELTELGVDIAKLESVKVPFPRMTYNEAIEGLCGRGEQLQ